MGQKVVLRILHVHFPNFYVIGANECAVREPTTIHYSCTPCPYFSYIIVCTSALLAGVLPFIHSREGGALANFVFWRSVIDFQIIGAQQFISLVNVSLCVH